MKTGIFLALVVIGGVVWGEVLSCDSCGRECAAACGTRQFRTCCFNYLRKRTSPLPVDPSLRLELWLARSRAVRTIPTISATQLQIQQADSQRPNSFKDVNDVNVLISNPHEYNGRSDYASDYSLRSTM